jgi:hypothetical protein
VITERQFKELESLRKIIIRRAVQQVGRRSLSAAYRCGLDAGWDLCADEVWRLVKANAGAQTSSEAR